MEQLVQCFCQRQIDGEVIGFFFAVFKLHAHINFTARGPAADELFYVRLKRREALGEFERYIAKAVIGGAYFDINFFPFEQ